MDRSEGAALYGRAGKLAAEGRYGEALPLLDTLLEQYPEEPKLLYARAMCLAHVGRAAEALALCERLERERNYARAAALKAALTGKTASTPEAEPEREAETAPEAAPANPRRRNSAVIALAGLGAVIFVAGLGFLSVRGGRSQAPENNPVATPVPVVVARNAPSIPAPSARNVRGNVVTACQAWKCPKCGAVLAKGNLGKVWNPGDPIATVGGKATCAGCQTTLQQADVYGGLYDVVDTAAQESPGSKVSGPVSVLAFRLDSEAAPDNANAKTVCEDILKKKHPGATLDESYCIGIRGSDPFSANEAVTHYKVNVKDGKLPDLGEQFDTFTGKDVAGKEAVVLFFRTQGKAALATMPNAPAAPNASVASDSNAWTTSLTVFLARVSDLISEKPTRPIEGRFGVVSLRNEKNELIGLIPHVIPECPEVTAIQEFFSGEIVTWELEVEKVADGLIHFVGPDLASHGFDSWFAFTAKPIDSEELSAVTPKKKVIVKGRIGYNLLEGVSVMFGCGQNEGKLYLGVALQEATIVEDGQQNGPAVQPVKTEASSALGQPVPVDNGRPDMALIAAARTKAESLGWIVIPVLMKNGSLMSAEFLMRKGSQASLDGSELMPFAGYTLANGVRILNVGDTTVEYSGVTLQKGEYAVNDGTGLKKAEASLAPTPVAVSGQLSSDKATASLSPQTLETLLPRLGKVMDASVLITFTGPSATDAERISMVRRDGGKLTNLNTEKLKPQLPDSSFLRLPEVIEEIDAWSVKPDACQYIPEKHVPTAEIREVLGKEGSTERSEEVMLGDLPTQKTPLDWLVYGRWKFGAVNDVVQIIRVCFPEKGNTKLATVAATGQPLPESTTPTAVDTPARPASSFEVPCLGRYVEIEETSDRSISWMRQPFAQLGETGGTFEASDSEAFRWVHFLADRNYEVTDEFDFGKSKVLAGGEETKLLAWSNNLTITPQKNDSSAQLAQGIRSTKKGVHTYLLFKWPKSTREVVFVYADKTYQMKSPPAPELAATSLPQKDNKAEGEEVVTESRKDTPSTPTLLAPASSPKGSILFMSSRTGTPQMYMMKADGSEQRRLSTGSTLDIPGNCSPDGNRLVFVSNRDVPSSAQIYTSNLDGSQVSRLTNHAFMDSAPSWSPDGKQIAFESNRDGNFEIYVMDADGGDPRRLTNEPAWDSYAAWAPDGKRLAFATKRHGENNIEIYVMSADGTGATRLTDNTTNDSCPAWSPDGASIAFWSNRDGNDEIYVMNADGSGQKRLTTTTPHSSGSPSWSPDGTHIAFESDRDGNFEIYVMTADGSGIKRLTNDPSDDGRPVWTPAAG